MIVFPAGARLKGRAATNSSSSPKKIQLVQKIGAKIKLTQDFENVLKDIFEKVILVLLKKVFFNMNYLN